MLDQIEELKREINELKARYDQFPAYLSGLSHDIRTPLNSIIGFSDLLREEKVAHSEQKLYSQMITRSSRKLLTLMSNLIDLAKIETGNLVIYDQPVVIETLVEELSEELDEMKRLYEKGGVRLNFTVHPETPTMIRSDRNRLFQILTILMENGLKFTQTGRVELEIAPAPGKQLSFKVIDTGCGMSQELIDGIFDIFPPSEVFDGKKIKSRGMSLHVVHRICDLMNGTIRIISEPNKGTIITLTLPS
jgi:signal transduction histidine kinase